MIATQALSFCYSGGAELAFPDVNLPQGGVLLLQGRSGSGKSTWLALVAGLLAPSHGDLVVAGQPLTQLSAWQRDGWRARHIGFLPQQLHLSEALSVADNLGLVYFAAGRPQDPAAIRQALAALGVADLVGRKPSQLSGGQAQRVALARALLQTPQVILADEPTASLDDAAACDALALLQLTAQRAGASLVIATHDARVRQALPQAAVLDLAGPGNSATASRQDAM